MPLPAATPAWLVISTLAERELVRFFRQSNRVIGSLAQPIIFWLLFSEGLRTNQLGYVHFFPGTLAMILLFTAIFATITVIEDRNEGFLQSVLVAPTSRAAMVFGKILGGASIAVIQALLFLALGAATMGLDSSAMEIAWAVLLMAVMAVALTGLGFLIAWRMDSTHGFHAVMSVFLFPMWLLSGAFFPAGGAGWLGWVVRLNPLTYGVAGLRHYLHGGGAGVAAVANGAAGDSMARVDGLPSLALCWMATIAFAATTFGLSTWIAGTRTKGDLK